MSKSSNCNCIFDLLNEPCRKLFDFSYSGVSRCIAKNDIAKRSLLCTLKAIRFLAQQMRESYSNTIARKMDDLSTINFASVSIKDIFAKIDSVIEKQIDGPRDRNKKVYKLAHNCGIIREVLALGVSVGSLLEGLFNHRVEATHLFPGFGYGCFNNQGPDPGSTLLVINMQTKQQDWCDFLDVFCPIRDPKTVLRREILRMDGLVEELSNEDNIIIDGHNYLKVYPREKAEDLIKAEPIDVIEVPVSYAPVLHNEIQDVNIKVEK